MTNLPDHIDRMNGKLVRLVPANQMLLAGSHLGPGGQRYVNPDGPEAAQLLSQCKDEIRRLREENERLSSAFANAVMQAQCWKMEAAAHHSSLCEAYQAVTGATGEPGTWNGANPIRQALQEGEQ